MTPNFDSGSSTPRAPSTSRSISAQRVCEEARELAKKLGDKAREARAAGELGIIAFLTGEAGNSVELLGDALRTSIELKGVGAHIRYLNILGNGLTLFGRPEDAIRYFDRALQLVRSTPELDTSVLAVAGEAKALIDLNRRAEAEKLYQETLDRARLRDRRRLAAAILTEFADLARRAGERTRAIQYYEEAATLAERNELHRVVAMAMFGLAKLYREAGDLETAEGLTPAKKLGRPTSCPLASPSWPSSALTGANSMRPIVCTSKQKMLSTAYLLAS